MQQCLDSCNRRGIVDIAPPDAQKMLERDRGGIFAILFGPRQKCGPAHVTKFALIKHAQIDMLEGRAFGFAAPPLMTPIRGSSSSLPVSRCTSRNAG